MNSATAAATSARGLFGHPQGLYTRLVVITKAAGAILIAFARPLKRLAQRIWLNDLPSRNPVLAPGLGFAGERVRIVQ